jgi:general secretion pathway protein G
MGISRAGRKRGFTLIEVLMVVLIIGIIGTIVISRLIGASRKSKESALRADLQRMRVAIEYFESHTGALPPRLNDLLAPNGDAISADRDGAGKEIDREEYKGPYLITETGQIPKDPFTGAADWNYDNSTGIVHSSSNLTALDDTPYSSW